MLEGKSWHLFFSCLWLWLQSPFSDEVGSSTCGRGRLAPSVGALCNPYSRGDSNWSSGSTSINSAVLQTRLQHGSYEPVTGPLTRHLGGARCPQHMPRRCPQDLPHTHTQDACTKHPGEQHQSKRQESFLMWKTSEVLGWVFPHPFLTDHLYLFKTPT